jgi:hypothetical protein
MSSQSDQAAEPCSSLIAASIARSTSLSVLLAPVFDRFCTSSLPGDPGFGPSFEFQAGLN